MKISLLILACMLTHLVHGQETINFKVTLTGWQGNGKQLPHTLDTVFLNKTFEKTEKFYTNISINDTTFVIPDVPIGKHWLLFSTRTFTISPIPIVVCTKCYNNYSLFASRRERRYDNNIFQMIEVPPSYFGGNRALAKDFRRNLSKAEKKKFLRSGNFSVNFYLTKQGLISDPSFIPSDLAEEIKNIVLKGLVTVTNWRPAEINGRAADVEYTLEKRTLMNE